MYDVLFDVRILTLFNILDLIFLSDVNYFCNMTILYTLDVYEINVSQWEKRQYEAKQFIVFVKHGHAILAHSVSVLTRCHV